MKKKSTLTMDEFSRYAELRVANRIAEADRYWSKCMGFDAALDDGRGEKLKAFLKSRLSPEDHAVASHVIDNPDDDLQDNLTNPPSAAIMEDPVAGKAADAILAGMARIKLSAPSPAEVEARKMARGRQRGKGMASDRAPSAGDEASFFATFPDAKKIGLK